MLNVYKYKNYRVAILELVIEKKSLYGRTFTFEKLSKACRLQRNWLSAVLHQRGHLSADQIFMACKFLNLDEDQTAFIILLMEHERSISTARKANLKEKIDHIRDKENTTASVLKTTERIPALVQDDANDAVLMNINAVLIHTFLHIKSFRDNPESIRERLKLEKSIFDNAIHRLEEAKYVAKLVGSIQVLRDSIHLPTESAFLPQFRTQMRLKALEFMNSYSAERYYSFSAAFSAQKDFQLEMRQRFFELIKWAQLESRDQTSTDVYHVNFDLLRWS